MLSTLIQDRMFRAGAEAGIDLGEELEAVARAALEITGRSGLKLEVSREAHIVLPVTRATLLALIVNELVVNAAVHAFPDGQAGHVRLALRGPGRGWPRWWWPMMASACRKRRTARPPRAGSGCTSCRGWRSRRRPRCARTRTAGRGRR